MPLKIIYAGTPEFAVPALAALVASPHALAAVYTQPDRPAGRGRRLQASAVKKRALEHSLPIEQPVSLNDVASQAALAAYAPDLMVVAAYGLLLPQAVLDIPRFGCINIHASLLPRWRGAAPIQRAILAGDAVTGITIMQMNAGLDMGGILGKVECPIGVTENAANLHDRLAALGADCLLEALIDIEAGKSQAKAQDESQACYAQKLHKAEAELDWSQSAEQLHRQIRAFNQWPIAQTNWRGQKLRVWDARPESSELTQEQATPGQVLFVDADGVRVQTGAGLLCLTRVQVPGKKPVTAQEFANAYSLTAEVLGAG